MSRFQALRTSDCEDVPDTMTNAATQASLKALRRDLNELRRQARALEEPALEQCLTLAISLTASRARAD